LQLDEAVRTYEALHGKWHLMHCWNVLKQNEKWKSGQQPPPDDGRLGSLQGSRDKETVDSASTPVSVRPMGRDSAKKQRSSDLANSTESTGCLEVLQKMTMQKDEELKGDADWRLDYKQTVELQRRKEERKEREWALQIMRADLSSMDDVQREFYLLERRRILEVARRNSGGPSSGQ
jgi:hypothetical protein